VKKDTRIRIEAKMLILSLGLIFVPCINGAFSEENTKTIPKENIFEFASSRNMLTGDYDDKRGFWDKRGYGDKRSSDSLADNVIQEIDCEEFPGVCLFQLMGKNEEIRNSRAGLFFDKRGYDAAYISAISIKRLPENMLVRFFIFINFYYKSLYDSL
jgi:hypothetical protein